MQLYFVYRSCMSIFKRSPVSKVYNGLILETIATANGAVTKTSKNKSDFGLETYFR